MNHRSGKIWSYCRLHEVARLGWFSSAHVGDRESFDDTMFSFARSLLRISVLITYMNELICCQPIRVISRKPGNGFSKFIVMYNHTSITDW